MHIKHQAKDSKNFLFLYSSNDFVKEKQHQLEIFNYLFICNNFPLVYCKLLTYVGERGVM